LNDAQADEKNLKAQLASLEADLKNKVEQCKPVEPPKPPPPPVAKAPPPPPPAARHATLRLVGRFRRRGRHTQPALSWRQAGLRRDQLQPLCEAGRHQSDLSR